LFFGGNNGCSLNGTTKAKRVYLQFIQANLIQIERKFYIQNSKTNELFIGSMLRMGCPPQQEFAWWNLLVTIDKRTPW